MPGHMEYHLLWVIGEWDTSRDSSLFSFPYKSLQSDEETDNNKAVEQLAIGRKEQAGSRKGSG